MKSKYQIRHKILGSLQADIDTYDLVNVLPFEVGLDLDELADAAKLKRELILTQTDFLLLEKEINRFEINFQEKYHITQKGTSSFYDDKYITQGKNVRLTLIKDRVTLIVAIVGTLIALSTLLINFTATQKNSKAIDEMKSDINKFKAKQKK